MRKFFHTEKFLSLLGKRREQRVDGFKVVYLPTLSDFPKQPFVPNIIPEILEADFDLVHAHEDFQPVTFFAMLSCKVKGIPFMYTQERYYYPRPPWKQFYQLYEKSICKIVQKNADAIVARSTAAKEFLVANKAPYERIKVIPAGVDIEEFYPKDNTTFKETLGYDTAPLILTVARLHPNKGLPNLIKAMKYVIKKVPSAKLVILGKGSLYLPLKKLAHYLGIEHSVRFHTDPIPNNKMITVYSSCDIFVLPSLREPFGRALVEALACGKPAIATKIGGPKDLIIDEKTGFLVQPGDIKQLATRMITLLTDHDLAEKMGSNARRRIEKEYDWEVIANAYEEVYSQIL
jgi:glycosyltransferase involved in cell wall biosynthesis